MIYREKETLRLQRFTTTAIDSLNKDDYAISRWDRWAAIRGSHSKSPDEILKNLAAICAMADSVIVYKSVRTMYLRRKGKDLFKFRINLGRNPGGIRFRMSTPAHLKEFITWTTKHTGMISITKASGSPTLTRPIVLWH